MEFKLGNTRFTFTFGFFSVLCVYCLYDRQGVGLPAVVAVALHECGHLFALFLAGGRVPAVRFEPFGIRMVRGGLLGYGQELLVYGGGPAMNLVLLLLSLAAVGWCRFAAVNLALLLFSLLPVGRLDGGQILRVLLCRFMRDLAHVEAARRLAGFLVLAPLFAAAFCLLPQKNFTLLLTAVYLALTLWKS